VKWRFSAPAGGVEGPAKCVSSVSPRFHYRRLTFCFLPLATILESPEYKICKSVNHHKKGTKVERRKKEEMSQIGYNTYKHGNSTRKLPM
jgi:hypothetical protein